METDNDDRREPTPARPEPVRPGQTINERSIVDEAAFESFPASDAPSWTGSQSGPPPTSASPEAEDDPDETPAGDAAANGETGGDA